MLDVARQFVLVDVDANNEPRQHEVRVEKTDLVARAKRIAELGSDVLVCGAVSWPLESMLISAGVRVIPNTCGRVEDVLAAFVEGKLNERAFLMPGCTAQCRRFPHRHRRRKKW